MRISNYDENGVLIETILPPIDEAKAYQVEKVKTVCKQLIADVEGPDRDNIYKAARMARAGDNSFQEKMDAEIARLVTAANEAEAAILRKKKPETVLDYDVIAAFD